MARPELPGAAVPHSIACSSISESDSHPLFQPPAKNALLFFVWLWYIGLEIVKAALKSSIFLFFLEQLCYFNLSPQGDGNLKTIGQYAVPQISTYPRKGTETTVLLNKQNTTFPFQLIPARGRKLDKIIFTLTACDFNLSPQGDGNESRPGEFQHPMISTYPRKGTETSCS